MSVDLMLCIHNHQPVGNFGWVFEEAFDRSYGPFLEVLEDYPDITITLHNTGPLLDWMEENRPEYLDAVRRLVERGQVEVMGGAYFEPIISIIPEENARSQIRMMSDYIEKRFGTRPLGMWMAERVWEPGLPRITAPEGVLYTLLDDNHFRASGLGDDDLFGYYITEYAGCALRIFPIDKTLRYTIPFREPEETIERLRHIAKTRPGAGVTYGDDGEKFGVWPGTYEWTFEEGWLRRFFDALMENSDWIRLRTLSDYVLSTPPTGRVYLPADSYVEMMEWALPARTVLSLLDVKERLKRTDFGDEAAPFVRGGGFSNFLAKYPESNAMHKRMLYVGRMVSEMKGKKKEEAQRHLLAAQCNCAYWHGLFGGLYLNYLRDAVYRCLSRAQVLAEGKAGPSLSVSDFDLDGNDEVMIETPDISVVIAPAVGGSMSFLNLKVYHFNLSNTKSRVFEAYHEEARRAVEKHRTSDGAAPESIHDAMTVDEELFDLFCYDDVPRYSFLDRLFERVPSLDGLVENRAVDIGGFSRSMYVLTDHRIEDGRITVSVRGGGVISSGRGEHPVTITKTYAVHTKKPEIAVSYSLESVKDAGTLFFAPEMNLTLLGGDDPQRYLLFPGGARTRLSQRTEAKDVSGFSLVNEFDGFAADVQTSSPVTILAYGVETASRNEEGLERTYQGSALLPIFTVDFSLANVVHCTVEMKVRDLSILTGKEA
ncbi:MAG: DUF1926 domain-containing protein [Deltaproteobacteria bacterium]|nr:DUF1926 domain-containing protein [Candidatus Zymogenaceae bacterium]